MRGCRARVTAISRSLREGNKHKIYSISCSKQERTKDNLWNNLHRHWYRHRCQDAPTTSLRVYRPCRLQYSTKSGRVEGKKCYCNWWYVPCNFKLVGSSVWLYLQAPMAWARRRCALLQQKGTHAWCERKSCPRQLIVQGIRYDCRSWWDPRKGDSRRTEPVRWPKPESHHVGTDLF